MKKQIRLLLHGCQVLFNHWYDYRRKLTQLSPITIIGATIEYRATLVHLVYMCWRIFCRMTHITMDTIVIQWYVK